MSEDAPSPDGPLDDATPGFSELLGREIADVEEGYSRGTLEVTDELGNPYGGLHGAALYTLADTGMGAAPVTGLGPGERMG